jgi:hypothetical protein
MRNGRYLHCHRPIRVLRCDWSIGSPVSCAGNGPRVHSILQSLRREHGGVETALGHGICFAFTNNNYYLLVIQDIGYFPRDLMEQARIERI